MKCSRYNPALSGKLIYITLSKRAHHWSYPVPDKSGSHSSYAAVSCCGIWAFHGCNYDCSLLGFSSKHEDVRNTFLLNVDNNLPSFTALLFSPILSSLLQLDLRSGFFPLRFPNKVLRECLFSSVRVTCSTYFTLTMLGKGWSLWGRRLCNCFHSSVTSSPWILNIFCSTLCIICGILPTSLSGTRLAVCAPALSC
jgi:hypothetical protein